MDDETAVVGFIVVVIAAPLVGLLLGVGVRLFMWAAGF